MYRAIIASVHPNATRSIYQLRGELINQFVNSPLCSSVMIKRDPVILDETIKNLKHQKIIMSESTENSTQDTVRNLLIVPDVCDFPDAELSDIDSVVTFGSLYKSKQKHEEKLKLIRELNPGVRRTVFSTGHVTLLGDEPMTNIPSSSFETLINILYPIGSQFLPARFREINPNHLALAVRLNYETCEFAADSDGIERLDYVDCMKIIGLDDRI